MPFRLNKIVVLTAAIVVLLGIVGIGKAQDSKPFLLTIIHTNDQHSHQEMERDGSGGGSARVATIIKQIRAEAKNTLLLDAGDRFTGTLFHRQYQGQDNVQVMNMIGYDAMTLGNHEFDNGDEVLGKFIDGLKFPVVSANIDFSASKPLAGKVKPYTILEVAGQKIGIIGLTTAETPTISSPSKDLKFTEDYASVVQPIVDDLTKQGINKIILVTHLGYLVDKKLGAVVSGVDVIVGGHSHTLISNTLSEAGPETYPARLKSKTGEPVLVVQAGSYYRFVGRLELTFDDKGIITKSGGDTIPVLRYITPDPDVDALIKKLAVPIVELQNKPIQMTSGGQVTLTAPLSTKTCRAEECVLGDLIADAMRANAKAQIALMNGGGIRADIPEGPVTVGDVFTVLPFGNLISTFKLKGADVVAALENGVSRVGADSGSGRFPQVSGVRFKFDPSKPVGSRVSDVEVLGADGKYAPIDLTATYSMTANDFNRKGGDDYKVLNDNAIEPYDFGPPLDQAFIDYLAANDTSSAKLEGRITIVK